MATKLNPYGIQEKKELQDQIYSKTVPSPLDQFIHSKRPRSSELRNEISLLASQSGATPQLIAAILQTIHRTWDNFANGSVSPNDFMRTPFGAPYEVVTIPGKGRGMIASRDIKAREIVLRDTPLLILPHEMSVLTFFHTLPKQALEAILLLHNHDPQNRRFSGEMDIPVHRLFDLTQGIMDNNSFDALRASVGPLIVLLLAGSLFNHSDSRNLDGTWEDGSNTTLFISTRDIKKGEELEVDYVQRVTGAAQVAGKRRYGIP